MLGEQKKREKDHYESFVQWPLITVCLLELLG